LSNRKSVVELSALAAEDLDDILQYTLQTWGAAQMDTYAARLQSGLQALQDNPSLGKQRDDLYPGCRCYRIEQHLVLYEIGDHAFRVARIFHQRMDPGSHL
jgi:toxin ParE1/3/4